MKDATAGERESCFSFSNLHGYEAGVRIHGCTSIHRMPVCLWNRSRSFQSKSMLLAGYGLFFILLLFFAGCKKKDLAVRQMQARLGDAGAQYALAMNYFDGKGVERNSQKGAEWLQKAAIHGSSPAVQALGKCYFSGDGVPVNYPEAMKWFAQAAGKNDPIAQYYLGFGYLFGKGVPKDVGKGIESLVPI